MPAPYQRQIRIGILTAITLTAEVYMQFRLNTVRTRTKSNRENTKSNMLGMKWTPESGQT